MSDQILNGSNPNADRRLLADIAKADDFDGDAFDGGCPADVLPSRVPAARADDIPTPAAFDVEIAKLELRYKYLQAMTEHWDTIIELLRNAYLCAEEDVGEASKVHFVELSEKSRNALKRAQGVSEGLMRARHIIIGERCRTAGKDPVI